MRRESSEKIEIKTDERRQITPISNETPDAIANMATMYCLIGALLILLSAAVCIALKEIGVLVFCMFGIWLLYTGVSFRGDYMHGKIRRMPVRCLNVKTSRFGDKAVVAFETLSALEDTQYLQFRIPGKKRSEDLIPDGSYLIYYYTNRPDVLLTFEEI